MRETLRNIDVPGAVATYKYEQTNGMADKMENERNAITATTPDEGGTGGGPGDITKCAPHVCDRQFRCGSELQLPQPAPSAALHLTRHYRRDHTLV